MEKRRQLLVFLLSAASLLAFTGQPRAQSTTATSGSVLFIGNSFTFGAGTPVQRYRPQSVTDLNNEGVGGVPALFKAFTTEAGLNFSVSLETISGAGLDRHLANKTALLKRPWDRVVMHGYSTLDQSKPGNPELLVRTAKEMAEMLHEQNPKVDIRLIATWARADQTYPDAAPWHGKPIETMAKDVRTGYDLAAKGTPFIRGVIPVGEAWNRAIAKGIADPNPYDGITAGQIDLWGTDHYHASSFGYYLDALVVFGDLTGLDPRSLGGSEGAATELGLASTTVTALQQVAFEQLAAEKGGGAFKTFKPVPLPR
jgi:hypothetical protein